MTSSQTRISALRRSEKREAELEMKALLVKVAEIAPPLPEKECKLTLKKLSLKAGWNY